MKKRYLFPAIGLMAAVYGVGDLLIDAGHFKEIEPHFSGSCQIIEGIAGAEDISFLANQNKALVSAYDRREHHKDKNAGIFSYDLETQTITKVSPLLEDFSPHGISIYNMPDGSVRVFVINHANQSHQINIFDFIDGALVLKNTVTSSQLISPNDLVAVGPNQFYVSNDHKYTQGLMQTFEDYLRWDVANVVFYDGENFTEAASNIGYANGINVSIDGELLYVNSVTGLKTYVYERNIQTHTLSFIEEIPMGSGVDNIELDEKGNIWMGSHPKLLQFSQHAKDEKILSPSQVLKLVKKENGYEVEEVYLDSGEQISGSSVAAVKNNRMLVGAVFDAKLLDCTLTGKEVIAGSEL
jgi:arylesterase/paraoxonase